MNGLAFFRSHQSSQRFEESNSTSALSPKPRGMLRAISQF